MPEVEDNSLSNLNLKFSSDPMLSFFFAKLKEEIEKSNDQNDRNFKLAVALKNQGSLFDFRKDIRGIAEPGTEAIIQRCCYLLSAGIK